MNEPATVRVANVDGRPPRQTAPYWLALGTFAIALHERARHTTPGRPTMPIIDVYAAADLFPAGKVHERKRTPPCSSSKRR